MFGGECDTERATPHTTVHFDYGESIHCYRPVTDSQTVGSYRVTGLQRSLHLRVHVCARVYARVKDITENPVTTVTKREREILDRCYSQGYSPVTVGYSSLLSKSAFDKGRVAGGGAT
jgi:hypothetical protein